MFPGELGWFFVCKTFQSAVFGVDMLLFSFLTLCQCLAIVSLLKDRKNIIYVNLTNVVFISVTQNVVFLLMSTFKIPLFHSAGSHRSAADVAM